MYTHSAASHEALHGGAPLQVRSGGGGDRHVAPL